MAEAVKLLTLFTSQLLIFFFLANVNYFLPFSVQLHGLPTMFHMCVVLVFFKLTCISIFKTTANLTTDVYNANTHRL